MVAILILVARRLMLLALVLFLVSLLTFAIVNVLPGNVAYAILGDTATPQQVAALQHQLGLDLPLWQRYLRWIGGLLHGDLGTSLQYGQPIGPLLLGRVENSAVLAVGALVFAVPIAIGLGVVAAVRPGSVLDRVISGFVVVAFSLPEYVIALVLILAFSIALPLLPGSSLTAPGTNPLTRPSALVLPMAVLTLTMLAYLSQVTRTSMIDTLASDYIRTAYLKGLRQWAVLIKHALRNALLPTLQEVGMTLGYTLGGLVIVETVFSYSGVGQLMATSVDHRDVPTIEATVLLVAVAYGVGNLLADVGVLVLNPRLGR